MAPGEESLNRESAGERNDAAGADGLLGAELIRVVGRDHADPAAQAAVPHIDYVREAGSEGIELVMWLIARGAMADVAGGAKPVVKHRFYHVPASNTAVGHLILENP